MPAAELVAGQALLLAAPRLQAVVAPIMTTIRPRELERMLHRLGASVCVTVDEWAGFDHAAALGEIAPRLPELRHRVVIGEPDERRDRVPVLLRGDAVGAAPPGRAGRRVGGPGSRRHGSLHLGHVG